METKICSGPRLLRSCKVTVMVMVNLVLGMPTELL
jgi:hypothetical protein